MLSTVVMAHPVRAGAAHRLANALGRGTTVVFDPEPNGTPSPLRTAVRAWAHCVPGATHHLVVQDDVEPCARFWALTARAVDRFPGGVLSLYANATCDNGAAARVALLAGYTWVAPVPHDYFPCLAVVMPCAVAHRFAAWGGTRAALGDRDDDRVLACFLATHRHEARLRVPTLVEHRGLASLAGYDHQGTRTSLCFQRDHPDPDREQDTPCPPVWPMFIDGHAILRVAAPLDEHPPQTLVGEAHASFLGVSADRLRRIAGEAFARPVPVGGRPTAWLRFARELCLACYSLGWALSTLRADPPVGPRRTAIQDAALRSYLQPGLGPAEPVDALLDGAWAALRAGLDDARPAVDRRTTVSTSRHIASRQIKGEP